jgi:hypothetical protein
MYLGIVMKYTYIYCIFRYQFYVFIAIAYRLHTCAYTLAHILTRNILRLF